MTLPDPRREDPPAPGPARLPWERRRDETDQQWDGFRRYRDLGPSRRSLSRVASDLLSEAASRPPEEGRHRQMSPDTKNENVRRRLEQWSSRNDWRERVEAWDMEIDRRKREETLDEVLQMAKRHAELSQAMITSIAQPAIRFLQRLRDDPRRLDEFTDKELLSLTIAAGRVMPAVAQMERLARGQATERIEVQGGSGQPHGEYVMSEDHMIGLYAAMAEVGWVPQPPPGIEQGNGGVVDVPPREGDA